MSHICWGTNPYTLMIMNLTVLSLTLHAVASFTTEAPTQKYIRYEYVCDRSIYTKLVDVG